MTGTRVRQVVYAAAALVGLVLTWYFNLDYAGSDTYNGAWFANSAASSAAVDLIVLSSAASLFMVVEGRRLRMRLPLLHVVAGVVLAMAFAVPLFLCLRERALSRAAAGSG